MSDDLRAEVADRMYLEAEQLDDGALNDWLEGLAKDVRYLMPARHVLPRDKDPEGQEALERRRWGHAEGDGEILQYWLYDEDLQSLTMRVRRLDTGLAYAELPESITSRMITNIRVTDSSDADVVFATSKLLIHQVRHEDHEDFFLARRWDRYRREDGRLLLARRYVEINHPVLPRTISILF